MFIYDHLQDFDFKVNYEVKLTDFIQGFENHLDNSILLLNSENKIMAAYFSQKQNKFPLKLLKSQNYPFADSKNLDRVFLENQLLVPGMIGIYGNSSFVGIITNPIVAKYLPTSDLGELLFNMENARANVELEGIKIRRNYDWGIEF